MPLDHPDLIPSLAIPSNAQQHWDHASNDFEFTIHRTLLSINRRFLSLNLGSQLSRVHV